MVSRSLALMRMRCTEVSDPPVTSWAWAVVSGTTARSSGL